MFHLLKLQPQSFQKIVEGTKTIEVRLYDEKRQKIQLGDVIEFRKEPDLQETIRAEVVGLLRYQTFEELLNDFPIEQFGGKDKKSQLEAIYSFYSKEKEHLYTVLGIRIKITHFSVDNEK